MDDVKAFSDLIVLGAARHEKNRRVTLDDVENVVKVVCDTRGKSPHAFHLLRLMQLLFEPFSLLRCALELGEIPDRQKYQADIGSLFIIDSSGVEGHHLWSDPGEVMLDLEVLEVRVVAQDFLQQLATRTTIYHFEITRPSLQDIFVRIARPELTGQELAGAAAT